jgi:hypothetical protein
MANIQAANTGNLEAAQNVILTQCRYTAEFDAPMANLIEKFSLGKGNKQLTVPKVSAMTASALQDGVDILTPEDIGLSTTDLTTNEVGLKVVLTDKLLRQFNEDVFKLVGKQMGDAYARYKDRAIIALFSALNGGTVLGSDNSNLTLKAAQGCVARATAGKYPSPVSFVHHPNAIAYLSGASVAIGATYFAGIMPGLSTDLLRNFWGMNINGVNFFQDGNIDKVSGYDSAYGAIFSKSAMAILTSIEPNTERERDASLRGWEVVVVGDYGVFEIDDSYGAACQYEIGNLETTG